MESERHRKIDDFLERSKWVEEDHKLAQQSIEDVELALEVEQNGLTALEALHLEAQRRRSS